MRATNCPFLIKASAGLNLSPEAVRQHFSEPRWHFTFSLHLVDTECEHAFLSDKSRGRVLGWRCDGAADACRGMRRARSLACSVYQTLTGPLFVCFLCCFVELQSADVKRRDADKGFCVSAPRLFDANARRAKGDPIHGMQHCSVKMTSPWKKHIKELGWNILWPLWTQIYNYYCTKGRSCLIENDAGDGKVTKSK
jgi:hypothetical protein